MNIDVDIGCRLAGDLSQSLLRNLAE